MVGYAAMVLWYPIKLVAILLFDEGPLTSYVAVRWCCRIWGLICYILAVNDPTKGLSFLERVVKTSHEDVVSSTFHDAHLQNSWQQLLLNFPFLVSWSALVILLIYSKCTGLIKTNFVILVGQSEFHDTRTYWQNNSHLSNILLLHSLNK
jgi:hypothetical protein